MDSFNKLNPDEVERLVLLMEEAAEVVQICAKILRHGYESYNPVSDEFSTNRHELEYEVGHVNYAMAFMAQRGDIDMKQVLEHGNAKRIRVARFLHHNKPV